MKKFFKPLLAVMFIVFACAVAPKDVMAYVPGNTPINISDVRLDEEGKIIGYNDSIHVSCKIEASSPVSICFAQFYGTTDLGGGLNMELQYNSSTDRFEGEHIFTEDELETIYAFKYIGCTLEDGSSTTYYINSEQTFVFSERCLNNNHDYSSQIKIDPTCEDDGKIEYHCRICDLKDETRSEIIPALGHDFKQYWVKKATTKKAGEITSICKRCGVAEDTPIPKIKTYKPTKKSLVYNSKKQKPEIIISDAKNNKISASDYTISYKTNGKTIGAQCLKVTFKNNYSGSVNINYTIIPKGTNLSSISKKSKGFTAKWKKQTAQTTGYQIQYSTNKKFSSAKIVIIPKNKTTSKTVTGLKAKKQYYVRIRTYKTVSGKKYYSSWSSIKTIITK